jgi:nicotinamide riboside kinase
MEAALRTQRIALIGGPGSGKSTTAADLFVQLKKLGKNTELVQEWIRRDIHHNGVMSHVFEQYRTMMKHQQEESDFPAEVEYLICDGNTLLPYIYTAVYSEKNDHRERLVLSDMYDSMLNDLYAKRYDRIYIVPRHFTDGANLDDGTRFQTPDENDLIERLIMMIFLELHHMDNIKLLNCPLHRRTEYLIRDLLGPQVAEEWRCLKARELM